MPDPAYDYTTKETWFPADGQMLESREDTDTPTASFHPRVVGANGATLPVSMTSISAFDQMYLYIVFRPSGGDSIPVYLRVATWGWGGVAISIAGIKILLFGYRYANPSHTVSGEVTWCYDSLPNDFVMKQL
jgi:hypothetical protein